MRDHFRIRLLPASYGDCILLSYGDMDRPRFVLIDSGPAHTYDDVRNGLRQSLGASGEFELLVITHIDADHIEGAINLLHDPELHLFRRRVVQRLAAAQPADSRQHSFRARCAENPRRDQADYVGVRLYDGGVAWNRRFGGRSVLVPDVGWLPDFELEGGLRLTLLSPSAQKLKALRSAWSAASPHAA